MYEDQVNSETYLIKGNNQPNKGSGKPLEGSNQPLEDSDQYTTGSGQIPNANNKFNKRIDKPAKYYDQPRLGFPPRLSSLSKGNEIMKLLYRTKLTGSNSAKDLSIAQSSETASTYQKITQKARVYKLGCYLTIRKTGLDEKELI